MVSTSCLLSHGNYYWIILLVLVNDEHIVELYQHIPPSMSMLGIVLFKYSGNVWLHMLFSY